MTIARCTVVRLAFAVLAASLLMWSATATAATQEELFDRLSDEEEALVIELIDQGQEAYADGDYDRAASRFHEVHNLFPHPSVSYRLARCYEELGNTERALQYYNHFLELDPEAADRDDVRQKVEQLEAEIDQISFVRVESIPIGATIYVGSLDTAPVGETPDPVTLEPGDHEIFVEKEGYLSEQTTVSIKEGDDQIIQFELERAPEDPEARTRTPEPSRQLDDSDLEWWKPTITVGLVGLGGVMTYQAVRTDDPGMRRVMGIGAGAMFVGAAAFTGWWVLSDSGDPGRGLNMGLVPTSESLEIGIQGRF